MARRNRRERTDRDHEERRSERELAIEGALRERRGSRGTKIRARVTQLQGCSLLGPSKTVIRALLRKRIDELRRMSLEIRSTAVVMDSADMIKDDELRRISISLKRLERELIRINRKSEREDEDERSNLRLVESTD